MKISADLFGRRPAAAILLAAACHFAFATLALVVSYDASLDAFDRGAEVSPAGRVAATILSVLLFPVARAAPLLASGGTGRLVGTLLFAANSLAWGAAAWWLVRRATGRGTAAHAAPSPGDARGGSGVAEPRPRLRQ